MVAGILTGFAIRALFAGNGFVDAYIVNGLFDVGGKIFIASLKMLVVPLVFVSLVCSTSSHKDLSTLDRMGSKTLGFISPPPRLPSLLHSLWETYSNREQGRFNRRQQFYLGGSSVSG